MTIDNDVHLEHEHILRGVRIFCRRIVISIEHCMVKRNFNAVFCDVFIDGFNDGANVIMRRRQRSHSNESASTKVPTTAWRERRRQCRCLRVAVRLGYCADDGIDGARVGYGV